MRGFWKDQKGINHKIKDMPHQHILDCIDILHKEMDKISIKYGQDEIMDSAEFLDMAEKVIELDQELLNRYAGQKNEEFWKIVEGGGFSG